MGTNIFTPNEIFSIEGPKKRLFHYKFHTPTFQTISWSTRQKLFYRMQTVAVEDWDIEKLPADEKAEYKKIFGKTEEIPDENILRKCILVVYGVWKRYGIAVGIECTDHDNYVTFKYFDRNVNEIKIMCKKNNVTLNYDNRFTVKLLSYSYLNEIIPEEMWEYLAQKYIKLKSKDKNFAKKLDHLFPDRT